MLFSTAQLLAGILGASTTAVAVGSTWLRRRGVSRNAHGRCARCGAAWAERYPEVERALVDGVEICVSCRNTLQVRTVRGAAAVLGTVALVAGATVLSNGYDIAIGNQAFSWNALLYWVPPTAVALTVAAVLLRRAVRRNRASLAASGVGVPLVPANTIAEQLATWSSSSGSRSPDRHGRRSS